MSDARGSQEAIAGGNHCSTPGFPGGVHSWSCSCCTGWWEERARARRASGVWRSRTLALDWRVGYGELAAKLRPPMTYYLGSLASLAPNYHLLDTIPSNQPPSALAVTIHQTQLTPDTPDFPRSVAHGRDPVPLLCLRLIQPASPQHLRNLVPAAHNPMDW
jgi:hypothetical protein